MAAPMQLTRTHRILIGVVVFGAVVIAAIGFAGSYAAVRELAEQKGFGALRPRLPDRHRRGHLSSCSRWTCC